MKYTREKTAGADEKSAFHDIMVAKKINYVSTTNKKAYALNAVITSHIPIWMVIIFCPGQKEEKRNMIISKCFVFPVIEAIYDNQN